MCEGNELTLALQRKTNSICIKVSIPYKLELSRKERISQSKQIDNTEYDKQLPIFQLFDKITKKILKYSRGQKALRNSRKLQAGL